MKIILKVREDFYEKELHVGDTVPTFGGSYKILELDYRNEFGSFILCEYIEKESDPELDSKWTKKQGVQPNSSNPFEIIGTIFIPDYKNLLAGIGFFVKNHEYDEILGLSYEQTWNLLFHEGARNAEASSSHFNQFRTKLIDTIDELPSLDSVYWKIPAYNSEGTAYAPFTKEALLKLEKGIEHIVDYRVRARVRQNSCNLSEKIGSEIKNISQLIRAANKIVVLSGAGISTNSGIPDYRSSAQSVWKKNPEALSKLNQETFEEAPEEFWDSFYQLIEESLSDLMPFPTHEALLATIKAIKPNDGHQFFHWLQKEFQKDVTIITQNVDGLDKKAGSQKVIEMHGSIFEVSCPRCQSNYPLAQVLKKHCVPTCECGTVLRPNLVFFGDPVRQYQQAVKAVEVADLAIVVGTSMQVSPFNQLISDNEQAKLVLLNGEELNQSIEFHHSLFGDISRNCRNLKNVLKEK